jgi:hypothetical protein
MDSSAPAYRKQAAEMMRRALASFADDERQEYLQMAAAWATLAESAESAESDCRKSSIVVSFESSRINPSANESDQ